MNDSAKKRNRSLLKILSYKRPIITYYNLKLISGLVTLYEMGIFVYLDDPRPTRLERFRTGKLAY